MSSTLSSQEKARFERDGILVLPDQFSTSEVERLRRALDRLQEYGADLTETEVRRGAQFVIAGTRPGGGPRILRVVWCGAAHPELQALGVDRRILGNAAGLLGETAVDQLVSQVHFKEPNDGVEFPPHQDAWNRRYGTELWNGRNHDGDYVQVLLTVDAMTLDNGPLLYVPGSHRWGPLVGDDRRSQVDAVVAERGLTPVLGPPGTLVFFGPFLIHGSRPNQSSGPRRVVINGYARVGVNRRRYHGAGTGIRRVVVGADEHRGRGFVSVGSSTQLRT